MSKKGHLNAATVAVITRTKNRPLLLERAILSVHNQTMTDYIHVIINDAGDKSQVEGLVNKHSKLIAGRVKVIHNTVSKGMEAASNKAIKSVESTYIAIHDDDDTWAPDFLLETTKHLESTGSEGVVATTDRVIEKIEEGTIATISTERWLPDVDTISLYKQCRDNYATPITFLYRRRVLQTIGYYDEELPVAGDWDFGLRFLCTYDIDFLKTDHPLAFYHHRPDTSGVDTNSVFVDSGYRHRYHMNKLANKYLRTELAEGRLGIGYLMSMLADNRDQLETAGQVAAPIVREALLPEQQALTVKLEKLIIQRTSLRARLKRRKP